VVVNGNEASATVHHCMTSVNHRSPYRLYFPLDTCRIKYSGDMPLKHTSTLTVINVVRMRCGLPSWMQQAASADMNTALRAYREKERSDKEPRRT